MTGMRGTSHLEPATALPATLPEQLVARVQGAAAAELARRLGPARLFTPSEDDRALVWAVISERLAEAHRDHVLAGNTPLDEPQRERAAQAVFDALLGLGPLERHLAGDDVEELLVNGHQRAFVVRAGGTKDRVVTGFPRRRSCGRSPPAPWRSPAAAWMRPTPKPTPGCPMAAACMWSARRWRRSPA
jgi:hypothetical protein